MGAVGTIKSQAVNNPEIASIKDIRTSKRTPEKPDFKLRQTNRKKIESIVRATNNYLESTQRELKIQIHKGTGHIMVKVVSKQDGKIIREVPSEDLLNLVKKMDEMIGILFYGKA